MNKHFYTLDVFKEDVGENVVTITESQMGAAEWELHTHWVILSWQKSPHSMLDNKQVHHHVYLVCYGFFSDYKALCILFSAASNHSALHNLMPKAEVERGLVKFNHKIQLHLHWTLTCHTDGPQAEPPAPTMATTHKKLRIGRGCSCLRETK